MKNLFASLLSCLMISLFLSCSMEPEQNFVENEKETFESLKMKVEAMAQEYGVGVSINESVWRKRLPSIDDIEKDFIRIKELSAANKAKMDTSSTNATSTVIFNSSGSDVVALENKPKVLKSFNEQPIYGSYDKDVYISDGTYYYTINVEVSWKYGGGSYVSFAVNMFDEFFNRTSCEVVNPTYQFAGRSFIASCTINHFRDINHVHPYYWFYVSTTYNADNGVGYIEVNQL